MMQLLVAQTTRDSPSSSKNLPLCRSNRLVPNLRQQMVQAQLAPTDSSPNLKTVKLQGKSQRRKVSSHPLSSNNWFQNLTKS